MKRVWFAAVIALLLVSASIYYAYNRWRAVKALKEHVSTVMAPQPARPISTAAPSPDIDVVDQASGSNPLNLDTDLLAEEECCPEEEFDNLLEAHAGSDESVTGVFVPSEGGGSDDGLTREQRFRRHYVKEWGDTPEVHTYVDLLMKQLDNEPFSFQDMLTWARLSYHFEPSPESKAFLDSIEEVARVPEHLRTSVQIE